MTGADINGSSPEGPARYGTAGRHTTAMALTQPERGALVPERFALLRGSLATTA